MRSSIVPAKAGSHKSKARPRSRAAFLRVTANKKRPRLSWRHFAREIVRLQRFRRDASASQDYADVRLPLRAGVNSVGLVVIADTHLGAFGTDYRLFERITDEIVAVPDLFVALLGDIAEFAIKLRSVAEVCNGQAIGPDLQVKFVENWLEYIGHKVAFATWDNHAIVREEKASGVSEIQRLLAERFVYFDGIGHPDVRVGRQVYKLAVTHRFRGHSYINPLHAPMRYLRMEGPDREVAAMADIHIPAFGQYAEGPRFLTALVAGTLNIRSRFARRYFSLTTHPDFPMLELHGDEHRIVPYRSIGDWLQSTRRARWSGSPARPPRGGDRWSGKK